MDQIYGYGGGDVEKRYVGACSKQAFIEVIGSLFGSLNWVSERVMETGNAVDIMLATENPGKIVAFRRNEADKGVELLDIKEGRANYRASIIPRVKKPVRAPYVDGSPERQDRFQQLSVIHNKHTAILRIIQLEDELNACQPLPTVCRGCGEVYTPKHDELLCKECAK